MLGPARLACNRRLLAAVLVDGKPTETRPLPVPKQNERLLDTPSDVDAERDGLAREQQDMWGGLARLQPSSPSTRDSDGTGRAGSVAGGGCEPLLLQVEQEERRRRAAEAALTAERQLRQQAQHDFQELLQSVEMLHPAPSRSPVSVKGVPPSHAVGSEGSSPADAPRQFSQTPVHQQQLQAAFSALESVAHRLCSISGDGGWAPQPAPLCSRLGTEHTSCSFAGLATC